MNFVICRVLFCGTFSYNTSTLFWFTEFAIALLGPIEAGLVVTTINPNFTAGIFADILVCKNLT